MCIFNFENKVIKLLKSYNNNSKGIKNLKNSLVNNNKLGTNIRTSFKICNDNYVGTISKKSSKLWVLKDLRFENKSRISINKKGEKGGIVILLESPHKYEYGLNLIAPALGATGEKIHNYLHKLLYKHNLLEGKEKKVYLVNAIQYQCSLGYETSVCRNYIFKELWKEEKIKNSLKRRLRKIKPSLIIVATTKINGFDKKNLGEEVSKHLKIWGYNNIYIASSHASCWNEETSLTKAEENAIKTLPEGV